MKSAIAILALAAVTSAQTISGIPECARSIVDEAITRDGRCAIDDKECICDLRGPIIQDFAVRVDAHCGGRDLGNSITAIYDYCGGA
ncbi:hypothetical protein F4777DRAFT_564439 [Nemania sp. FL0916]|nr:hypothetical protein F4777DRAFT_564439 [Nemania sp. FL0916]